MPGAPLSFRSKEDSRSNSAATRSLGMPDRGTSRWILTTTGSLKRPQALSGPEEVGAVADLHLGERGELDGSRAIGRQLQLQMRAAQGRALADADQESAHFDAGPKIRTSALARWTGRTWPMSPGGTSPRGYSQGPGRPCPRSLAG